MKEALYYSTMSDGRLRCSLCPHLCVIPEGKRGICGVRENRDGKLFALTYERPASAQMDPIEKKPLYHVYPGAQILSLGSIGCNFACGFCQNWSLVTGDIPASTLPVSEIPGLAARHDSIGVAWTYNEPFIWYEYIKEAGKRVKEAGLINVLVTNGYVNTGPLEELLPLIDAMNIDLKSIRDPFYRKNCRGTLDPVKETITIAARSCLVEVTNLLIPDENDDPEEITTLVDFIADISPDIPLHFSRYFPHRSYSNPPTPAETLISAYEIARKRLNYVYLGNIALDVGNNTTCPHCQTVLVERRGYRTTIRGLDGTHCGSCRTSLNFINTERP